MSSITTNDWDGVFAITYAKMNDAMAQNTQLPKSMTFSDRGGQCSLTLGKWQLAFGGGDQNIGMSLEVTGGTYTDPKGAVTNVSPAVATFTLNASFVPQPGNQGVELVAGSGAISFGDLLPAQPNFTAYLILKQLMADWLRANMSLFNLVFISIDLSVQLPKSLPWLKPAIQNYAVAEPSTGKTLDNCVFAVLTMFTPVPQPGQPPPPAPVAPAGQQVDLRAIPTGANGAVLISADQFINHFILHAAPDMFDGISQDPPSQHFGPITNGITNITPLTVTVKLKQGNVETCSIPAGEWSISVQGPNLVIAVKTLTFNYWPYLAGGFDVTVDLTTNCTMSYDAQNDLLDLLPLGESKATAMVNQSTALQIVGIALDVIAIAGAIVGGVSAGLSKVTTKAIQGAANAAVGAAANVANVTVQNARVAVVASSAILFSRTVPELDQLAARLTAVARVGAMTAVVAGVPGVVILVCGFVANQQLNKSAPKFDELIDVAMNKVVKWPAGVGVFKTVSAQLNDSLQIGMKA